MPPYWKSFLIEHQITDAEFTWSVKSGDISYIREIRLLSDEESRYETEEAHPGIIVSRDGFHAVADDLCPSGDLYFINVADGIDGPLYKIYHESISDINYRREDAIVVALPNFRELLQHRKN